MLSPGLYDQTDGFIVSLFYDSDGRLQQVSVECPVIGEGRGRLGWGKGGVTAGEWGGGGVNDEQQDT